MEGSTGSGREMRGQTSRRKAIRRSDEEVTEVPKAGAADATAHELRPHAHWLFATTIVSRRLKIIRFWVHRSGEEGRAWRNSCSACGRFPATSTPSWRLPMPCAT